MSSSTAGPGGSTERLQGSLRNSAIARLLVEGRLSSSSPSTAAADKVDDRRRRSEVHSPPPPIDLSTNRTNSKQVNDNDSAAAAVASFSLSTITTMEKLRCILACEVQSLLSRVSSTDQSSSSSSSNSNSIRYSCRLCPFSVSQVIELMSHYRLHGDTLAHIGHNSPDILNGWFDYYLKTSPMRCSTQSLAGASEVLGVMTPTADSSSSSSSPAFRLDLRTLLLQPFKATNALLLSSTGGHRSPGRHRACSESHPLRQSCRSGDGGAQSRSSTPYTMISGLTDDENQQQTGVYGSDRYPRWGPTNGRQSAGVYPGEVSVKCETEDATASPVRSPMSTNSERSAKDKGPNSQDSLSPGAEYLGQFQNGRLQGLAGGSRTADDLSPPTLKCEMDRSPYPDDRVVASHCFECDDRYPTNCRGHPSSNEALRKSSNIARLVNPGFRASDNRSPSLSCCSHPGISVSSLKDTALPVDQPEDGLKAVSQSTSPAPTQFRETVGQEYAYKQYKRLRKSNTPKSCRQESPVSPCHSLSKTPDDSVLSRTPSLPCDGSELLQRACAAQLVVTERSCSGSTKRTPQSIEIGVQCSLILPLEPNISVTEADEDDDDEEVDDETKEGKGRMGRSRRRVRRKRAFPADENEMPDITASDADCAQTRCSPCGITFDDDVIFSIHMGCHSHTDPFVCNICGRSCDNKYAFNTHILRGHHPT